MQTGSIECCAVMMKVAATDRWVYLNPDPTRETRMANGSTGRAPDHDPPG